MPANGISAVHPIPDPVVLVVLKCTLILGLWLLDLYITSPSICGNPIETCDATPDVDDVLTGSSLAFSFNLL
jgi:hypothetical protein